MQGCVMDRAAEEHPHGQQARAGVPPHSALGPKHMENQVGKGPDQASSRTVPKEENCKGARPTAQQFSVPLEECSGSSPPLRLVSIP